MQDKDIDEVLREIESLKVKKVFNTNGMKI